ncbi:LPS export ABC transporter periplasmic protein LptC [Oligoflexia bacterium]|nr:LPS export ABC transporter periplasmic protein LptC [Oligoflexia bacterium]
MNITLTKSQSRVLAVSILALFFIVAAVFIYGTKPRPSDNFSTATAPQTPTSTKDPEPPATKTLANMVKPKDGDQENSDSTFALKDFHRSEIKDGKIVWEVTGSNARFFPETNTVHIDNGEFFFFSEKKEPVRLSAGQAVLHLQGSSLNKAEATGGVKLNYDDRVIINTDEATYFLADNYISADGAVTINHKLIDTKGRGLHANLITREMKLLRKVKSVIKPRSTTDEK